MLVIVPSRGRPGNIRDLLDCWIATGASATLVVAIDDDDLQRDNYIDAMKHAPDDEQYQLVVGPRLRLAGTLNAVAKSRVMRKGTLDTDIVGFMGDDHRPRTVGWDIAVRNAFKTYDHAVVYGNDLLQGSYLPTQVFMTAGMIKKLGYMVPPGFIHMYLDNTWKEWGIRLDRLIYLGDVVIEHMHPIAGKSEWDDGYVEVNDGGMYAHDEAVFENYKRTLLEGDIFKLQELIHG